MTQLISPLVLAILVASEAIVTSKKNPEVTSDLKIGLIDHNNLCLNVFLTFIDA